MDCFEGPLEYRFRNFTVTSGFKLGSLADSGTPVVNIYDFYINEGDSFLYFGDAFAARVGSYMFEYLVIPVRYLFDYYAETVFNTYMNMFLEPIFLRFGDIVVPIDFAGFGNLEYEIDIAMPLSPTVTDSSLQLYFDAGIYAMNENSFTEPPEKALKFIDDDNLGFQVAISEFMVNQLFETLIQTNFTNIIPFDFMFNQIQFHITSDMLEPLIP